MEGVSSHRSFKFCILMLCTSLLPKFDELYHLTDFHRPDVICITESWLCPDVLDSEISISGYQTMRLDRNRHGRVVLVYVLDKYIVKRLPSHASLELLTVNGNYRSCFSLFYHPPSSPADILYPFMAILSQLTFHSSLVLYSSVIL